VVAFEINYFILSYLTYMSYVTLALFLVQRTHSTMNTEVNVDIQASTSSAQVSLNILELIFFIPLSYFDTVSSLFVVT